MRRCTENNVGMNPAKTRIKQPEIKFFGVICSGDGARPNPKKVNAIKQISTPENRQQLLLFLGLATYMGMFIENLSKLATPLR